MTPSPTPFPVPLPVDFPPTVTDWLMVVLTLLGLLITGSIAFLTFRANARATEASREAADASREAAEANSRAQEAQMRALTEALARAAAAGPSSGVKWKVAKDRHQYDLVNEGESTAFRTTLTEIGEEESVQDMYVFNDGPVDVPPGSAIPFTIERSLASPPVTAVSIVWVDAEGVEHREQRILR